ncbi:hypothetical protein L3X38_012417 [Prunus dulcis]|uniref:CCHC-type domain-containing protein n=1 Tax=Prunus dulcis TaxID=3755 RepID=A0AAD4WJA6_PRUDU|nr:hypothetical protein L3X38_012417 [Prunus dulcis]
MIWIISTLSTDLLSHTVGIEYSRDLWEMLEKRFAGVSRANVHHLRQRLQNLVKGDLSIVSSLQQMKEIADGLGDAGHPLTDDDLVAYILADLSEEYDSFVTSIETRREKVSSDELHGYLLGHEATLLKRKLRSNFSGPTEPFHAYAATPRSSQHFSRSRGSNNSNSQHRGFHSPNFSRNSSPGDGNSNSRGSSSFNSAGFSSGPVLVCQFCNKKGHAANTCRKLGRLLNASGSSSSYGPFTSYYANPQSAASSPSWIVDSGATAHVTATNQHL